MIYFYLRVCVCLRVGNGTERGRVTERLRDELRLPAGLMSGRAPVRRARTTVRRIQRLSQRPWTSARLRTGRLRRHQPRRAVFCRADRQRQNLQRRLRRRFRCHRRSH